MSHLIWNTQGFEIGSPVERISTHWEQADDGSLVEKKSGPGKVKGWVVLGGHPWNEPGSNVVRPNAALIEWGKRLHEACYLTDLTKIPPP